MIAPTALQGLLDGPAVDEGPESFADHVGRLGTLPHPTADALIDAVERAGLRGRGGASYPTARKLRAVASRAAGGAVVVANGAETEPLNGKDHLLLTTRPHLVLDGLNLAAAAVGARRALVYVTRGSTAPILALNNALRQRREAGESEAHVSIVQAPHRYVAGEETAVIAAIGGRPSRPTLTPPRPFERGVDGLPTLVQNVETLAHLALIARFGPERFAAAGSVDSPGTTLLSTAGAIHRSGVLEVSGGSTIAQVVSRSGGAVGAVSAFLVGGYFGRWVPATDAWDLRLGVDIPLGSGLLAVFPHTHCGVAQASAITSFLARESARQCGPCEHGLAALATTMGDLAAGRAKPRDTERLARWIGQVAGRGACHHPDGALVMLESALRTFAGDVSTHLRKRRCDRDSAVLLATPDWTRNR